MKVLVISNTFPDKDNDYFGDIFVKMQASRLSKYCDVTVLSPLPRGMWFIRKIKQVNYKFENVNIYHPKFFVLPMFYFFNRKLWVLLETRAILHFLYKENLSFDLIHAHYTWPSGAVAVELKKYLGIPVVITEHTSLTLDKLLKKKVKIAFEAWKYSDKLVCVSKKCMSKLLKLGILNNKICYIPNGYDENKFKPLNNARAILGIPFDEKMILSVGRLAPEKGQIYLLNALKAFSDFDFKCYIVGNGPLKKPLQRHIDRLKMNSRILLVGHRSHKQIPLWLNSADLFVLPSLSENNPTVMFEALGVGLPFVGTRVGGIPEIITSEDYGLLAEPGNSKDLAEKIRIALNKQWDREKIREYAKQFTWDNIAKQILKVYEEVLNEHRRVE